MKLSDSISSVTISNCLMCNADHHLSKLLGRKLNVHLGFNIKNKTGVAVNVFKCKKCELIYSNPQPIGNDEHFRTLCVDPGIMYSQIPYRGSFEKELKILAALFTQPLSDLDALDLGFGYGNSIVPMKNYFKSVQGIEPFDNIFEFAINHPEINLIKNKLQKTDFGNAQFEKASVDFIFFEAFQHISNPSEGLQKALTWLRPNGIIYLEVPSANWLMAKIINKYYWLRGTDYVTNLSPLSGNYTNFEFTHKSFEQNSKLNGYKILQYEYIPCETTFKGITNKFIQYIMRISNSGMQLGIYLQKA